MPKCSDSSRWPWAVEPSTPVSPASQKAPRQHHESTPSRALEPRRRPAAAARTHSRAARQEAQASVRGKSTTTTEAVDRAIPGYAALSASQVIPRLDSLGVHELEAVYRHEAATRRRRTILHRTQQLRGRGPPPAPDDGGAGPPGVAMEGARPAGFEALDRGGTLVGEWLESLA